MRRRHWWSRLADSAAVVVGALTAAGLIAGLGWGAHAGWRLIAAAAAGLAVSTAAFELSAAPCTARAGPNRLTWGAPGGGRGRTKL
jgi:hypothetical protein